MRKTDYDGNYNNKESRLKQKNSRLGQKKLMNCGKEATIIDYISSHDITIKFEDGAITYHKCYNLFNRGRIAYADDRLQEKQYSNAVGTIVTTEDGSTAECIDFVSHSFFNVKYKGKIILCRGIDSFLNGIIIPVKAENRLFQKKKASNGQIMTIIAYRAYNDIDVQFDDNTIVTSQRYEKFLKGKIVNPNNKIMSHTSLNEFVMNHYLKFLGFSKAPSCSLKSLGFGRMELDSYNDKLKIAVEYDGNVHSFRTNSDTRKDTACKKAGIELLRIRDNMPAVSDYSTSFYLKDISYFSKEYAMVLQNIIDYIIKKYKLNINIHVDFDKDKEKLTNSFYNQFHDSHIGQTFISNSGQKATIIKYINCNDITIEFENGRKRKTTHSRLLSGSFSELPHGKIVPENRIGETRAMHCGQKCTITAYVNCNDINVKFEDGAERNHVRYDTFSTGILGNPNIDTLANTMKKKSIKFSKIHIGETKIMNCGLKATIIDYRRSNDIDVRFENGAVITNKQYTAFARGQIACFQRISA